MAGAHHRYECHGRQTLYRVGTHHHGEPSSYLSLKAPAKSFGVAACIRVAETGSRRRCGLGWCRGSSERG